MEDFHDLLDREPKTQVEAMLCEAIARLSSAPGFTDKTPWEVFDLILADSGDWLAVPAG
jgi:hypothetical protein